MNPVQAVSMHWFTLDPCTGSPSIHVQVHTRPMYWFTLDSLMDLVCVTRRVQPVSRRWCTLTLDGVFPWTIHGVAPWILNLCVPGPSSSFSMNQPDLFGHFLYSCILSFSGAAVRRLTNIYLTCNSGRAAIGAFCAWESEANGTKRDKELSGWSSC